jgi:hypothetical protein
MLPQEESIDILKKFLLHFSHSQVKGMTIEAIEQLARMVLTEQPVHVTVNPPGDVFHRKT